jgi:uncharacterized repeat protein (TIGR02543 family)
MWGTSYIPGDCKVVTANETIDYATIAGANATTSGKWIVNPRGGTTSGKKYTNLTSDTKGNPDGIVDNIATITSNVNMATIQVPSTAKYNQNGKYVIHMRITGITGIIAHGVTGSSGRGCAIYGQEYSTSLTENTVYGSALASMTRSGNSGSFLLQYTGFTASKEYLITIAATGGDDQLYAIELIAGAATKHTVTYDLNGATGTTPTQADVAEGAKFTLHDGTTSITAPTGKEFAGWNDGTTTYAGGAEYTMGTSNVTLTAQWQDPAPKYSVTYVLNGPSGDAPTQASVAAGTEITLAAAPSWAGHAFDGWLCSADAAVKAAGSSYTMTAANTTFTAQWHEVDCKIYSLTGGIGSAAVEAGDAAVTEGVSLVMSGSNGIIKLTPASGETFKAGDVVTISGTIGNTSKNYGIKISNAADKKATLGTASVAGTTNPLVATATLSANADYLYICRADGSTTTLLTCEVHRSCAEGEAAGLSYATAEVNKTEGDAAFTNALTNANGLVVAGYSSSNTAVATVDKDGQVTIVAQGTATITAHSAVQTKAGTLYAAGTATYTLNVAALPEYTVTYDLNGGSGDPTEVNHKEGEKFNLHDGVTGITAPTNKTFVNWKDQDDALFAGGAEYTMPAKNVTLTAQWAGDVYTVKYMDGETVLDTKVVEVGSHPADIEHPTKPLYTFASWQLSGSDVVLDDVNGTKDAEIILTVRWAAAYALDVNFKEAATQALGVETALNTYHYASDASDISFEAKGLKIKTNAARFYFNVAPGKVAEIKFGNISGATYSVDGGAAETLTSSQLKATYSAGAQSCVMTMTTDAYNIVEKITIHDPYTVSFDANGGDDVTSLNGTPSVMLPLPVKGTESFLGWFDGDTKVGEAGESYTPTDNITLVAHWEAISTDARLASITFSSAAGTLSPAFDPEVVNYTYTMPYPTATVPTITGATSVSAKAKTPVIDAQAANWGDVAHIHGVAESDDTKDYYITMKIAPKDGVSIIKVATTGGTNKTVTGLYAGDGDVKLSGDTKMNDGNYIGFILDGTTLQAGDRINVHTTTAANTGGSHVIFFDNMTDKNELYETGEIGGLGDNIFTINAAMVGATTAYVYRSNADAAHKWNGYVDYIEVTRAMNPVLKSIQFNSTDVAVSSTSVSATLPYGTNLGTMTITPEIIWNGAAAENSILINGSATGAWAWGENTYKLTDKDGDATTYTITLTEAAHYEAQIGTTGYATLVAAVAAAQADDVVKLLDNVDLMATGLTIAENITLDLNGFNIKAGEQIDNDIVVPAGKKLTLVDNSTDADGKIYTEQAYTGAVTGYGLIRVAGELLMQSGNIYAVIESDPANLGQFAVVIAAGGKVTVEGGQIKAGWYAISNNGNNTGSTIIVSGGELISTADFAIYNPAKESTVTVSGGVVYGAAGGIAMNRGELTVTGGTITSKDQGTTGTWGDGTGGMSNAAISASGKYESVEVEITGGTIIAEGTAVMITNGTTNPVEVAISGGQFSHVVPAEYCAPGFAPVTEPNAQGKYEVEDKRIYIFDGSTMSNIATSPSGAIAWEIVGSTMSAGDKDKIYNDVHYTRALSCGSSSTTKHFKIDVALNNAAKIEVIGMSNSSSDTRHAWLTNSTEKGDFADAIAGLTTTGYNPEMFTTDWLEEGSYYLHSDNTVAIFLIRVTEKAVDPKCEQPTITTQPATDLTFGAGNMTATVEAEVSDEGTLTYQWYNAANDEAVVGQTTATLTTADEGTYYVIVTNTKASHRDNSIKSDEAQLAHRVLNDATLSALSASEGTLDPTFDKNVVEYRVDLPEGTVDVPTLSATATMDGYANVAINNATAFVNYEATSTVVVTSEDGTESKTYTVKFYVDHQIMTLVDVTGNMKWDFSKANDGTAAGSNLCNDEIFANVDGIVNNDDFESDNIMATANKFSSNKLQASMIMFHTTVPGAVIVKCSHTGNNKPERYLMVNGVETELHSTNQTVQTYAEYVPAGDVVLTVGGDGNMFNFTSVEFKVDNDLEPARTDEWLAPGELGTICIPQGAVAVGADIYELVGKEPQYGKIVFETVEHMKPGKPYLFQAKGTRIDFILTDEAEASEPDNSGAMKGTFINLDLTELENVYYFAGHALWSCVDLTSLSVPANRAYVKLDEVEALQSPNPAPGRRRITLGVNGQNTATGLENLVGGEQAQKLLIDGQMYILRGEKLYDATGRLVK